MELVPGVHLGEYSVDSPTCIIPDYTRYDAEEHVLVFHTIDSYCKGKDFAVRLPLSNVINTIDTYTDKEVPYTYYWRPRKDYIATCTWEGSYWLIQCKDKPKLRVQLHVV